MMLFTSLNEISRFYSTLTASVAPPIGPKDKHAVSLWPESIRQGQDFSDAFGLLPGASLTRLASVKAAFEQRHCGTLVTDWLAARLSDFKQTFGEPVLRSLRCGLDADVLPVRITDAFNTITQLAPHFGTWHWLAGLITDERGNELAAVARRFPARTLAELAEWTTFLAQVIEETRRFDRLTTYTHPDYPPPDFELDGQSFEDVIALLNRLNTVVVTDPDSVPVPAVVETIRFVNQIQRCDVRASFDDADASLPDYARAIALYRLELIDILWNTARGVDGFGGRPGFPKRPETVATAHKALEAIDRMHAWCVAAGDSGLPTGEGERRSSTPSVPIVKKGDLPAALSGLTEVSARGLAKLLGLPPATVSAFLRKLRLSEPGVFRPKDPDFKKRKDPSGTFIVSRILPHLPALLTKKRRRRTSQHL
jgi:hypothetical protein